MRASHAILAAGVLVLAMGTPAQAAVNIETIPVGHPGNSNDTHGDGYGAVSYTYDIGKYEVTAGQYCEFLNAVAKTDTYGLYDSGMSNGDMYAARIEQHSTTGNHTYTIPSDWANRPVTRVSWGDAARFSNWLTNGQPTGDQTLATTEDGSYYLNGATTDEELMAVARQPDARFVIPSEDEWYKAAYYDSDKPGGAGYWDYPTGTDASPANDLVAPDPGNNANFYDNGYTIGSPYYRTEVGEFEQSDSPYGTYDQGGNVYEWTEAAMSTVSRGERGGSLRGSLSGPQDWLHASVRSSTGASINAGALGFRVAEVPEPAIVVLLGVGGISLLGRHRRKGGGA